MKQLMEAASQGEKHQPITDPAIQELLKGIAHIGSTASDSDERKSYMLAQLKSSIIHFSCPIIFLTINPCSVSASRAWCYTFKGLQTAIFWCSLVDSEIIHIFIHTLYLFHFDCTRL